MYSVSKAFAPSTPQELLREFSSNMMHYEFGDGFEVVKSKSQNGHPDRPQDLKIVLNDEELCRLKAHIDSLEEGEKKMTKREVMYVEKITKSEGGCSFYHESIYHKNNYTFFTARCEVDYQAKTVICSSCMY
jgi:hypothetical protein